MDVDRFARKAVCAVLPRSVSLRRTLRDGTVISGRNRSGYGGRGVFVFGDAIEPDLQALPSLVHPGDTVIDVGANTGLYTLVSARIVGAGGTVLSMEPNPEMLVDLHRNVRRNRYQNVRLRGYAASDVCGESSFFENDNKPNSFSLNAFDVAAAHFSIATMTIDAVAAWERLGTVSLVKIDAEGSEDKVILGAADVIKASRPAIIAEANMGGLTALPDHYVAFRPRLGRNHKRGPNRILLPADHSAIDAIQRLGWTEAPT